MYTLNKSAVKKNRYSLEHPFFPPAMFKLGPPYSSLWFIPLRNNLKDFLGCFFFAGEGDRQLA